MSCIRKGEKLYMPTDKGYVHTVIALRHDDERRYPNDILVVFPGTRHIARVQKSWLKRPRKGGKRPN